MVVKAAHGGDFSEYAGLHGGVHGGYLVDDFDGYVGVAVLEAAAEVYFGEAAAAEEAAKLVFFEYD